MAYRPDVLAGSLPNKPQTTIAETIDSMARVQAGARQGGYPHLNQFISTYLDVTCKVQEGVEEGRFQEVVQVERAVGHFDWLWEKQLKFLTEGSLADIALAWRPLLMRRAARRAPPGVQFLLGMGAHIIRDLPEALRNSGATKEYHKDFDVVVGDMIATVANKRAPIYVPVPHKVRNVVTDRTLIKIANWREVAWREGQLLQQAVDNESHTKEIIADLDRSAAVTTNTLLYGGSLALGPFAASNWVSRQLLTYNQNNQKSI